MTRAFRGIKVAHVKTCFWREDARPEIADISGRQAILWVVRESEGERFEASLNEAAERCTASIPLVADTDLGVVLATANDLLDELEAAGAQPAPGDNGPRRLEVDDAKLADTRAFIDRQVESFRALPPPTPDVDAEIVRELLRVALFVLSAGKASDEQFEAALVDAADAIANLPCDGCGGVHWPVLDKPKAGSIDWWDDPGAFFACRTCGRYLASAFAYPYIRQADDRYPLEGVVPSREQREAWVEDRLVRYRDRSATEPS